MILKNDKAILFSELEAGQTFLSSDKIYMKIDLRGGIECPECQKVFFSKEGEELSFAVDIVTGMVYNIISEYPVEPVECEVIRT